MRSEYADADRFPFASELHTGSVSEFLDSEDSESMARFSDVLLLGHDWAIDQEILLGLVGSLEVGRRPRVGAIGSTVKWNAFRDSAIAAGITEESVDSVRCPIGLDIGADSPEEIAIAVCAEIMAFEKKG